MIQAVIPVTIMSDAHWQRPETGYKPAGPVPPPLTAGISPWYSVCRQGGKILQHPFFPLKQSCCLLINYTCATTLFL